METCMPRTVENATRHCTNSSDSPGATQMNEQPAQLGPHTTREHWDSAVPRHDTILLQYNAVCLVEWT